MRIMRTSIGNQGGNFCKTKISTQKICPEQKGQTVFNSTKKLEEYETAQKYKFIGFYIQTV